jgi:hypothetical protein
MKPAERQLFAHGFASELMNSVERLPDSTDVARRIGASPQARERIVMALGPEKAQQLHGFMAAESAMSVLRSAVQGNSTTSRQLTELGLAGGALGADYFVGGHGSITAGTFGMLALRHGGIRINRNVAESVGKLLASDNPKAMQSLAALATKDRQVREALLSITPKAVAAIVPPVVGAQ